MTENHLQILDSQGYLILPNIWEASTITLALELTKEQTGTRSSNSYRNLLWQPCGKDLLQLIENNRSLTLFLKEHLKPISCFYFEKNKNDNWLVPMHQDLLIAVKEKVNHSELKTWSQKDGIWFVQPPNELLSKMLAVRIHLDDCNESDGPLKVIAASHNEITLPYKTNVTLTCNAGTAIIMRPLLWHASGKSTSNNRRRVLHFLFGPDELPFGLQYH